MNKVRISGDLLKIDKGKIRKYRCVVRSGIFFAYLNKQTDESTVMELYHFQKAEITLAVVTLTATTYILPTAINSGLTPYVLQLSCFETSQKFFFYVNCAASLDSWIEAIRAESCNDDLSLDVEEGELLPPTVNDDESSLYRLEDDGISYNITSPSTFSRVHENSSVRRMLLEEASFLRSEGLLSSQVPVKRIERNQWKTWSFKHNLRVTFSETSPRSPERSSSKEMKHASTGYPVNTPHHNDERAHKCSGNISGVRNKEKYDFLTRKLVSNDVTERCTYRPISTVTTLSNRIKRRNKQEKATKRRAAERPCASKVSSTPDKVVCKSTTATCGVKACGWLHCKNSVQKWDVAWATLTADDKLLFYGQNSPNADLNWSCDLSKGCSVEQISFGKCCAAFTIVYLTSDNTDRSKTSTFSSVNDSTASQQEYTKCTTRKMQLMCGSLLEFVNWMKSLASIKRKDDNDNCLSINNCRSISGQVRLLSREPVTTAATVSFGVRKFNTNTSSTNNHDVMNAKTTTTTATVKKNTVNHDEKDEASVESDRPSIIQLSSTVPSTSRRGNDVIPCKPHHAAVMSEKENRQLNNFLSSPAHPHRRSIKARPSDGLFLSTRQSSTSTTASSSQPCKSAQPTPAATTTTLKSGKVAAAKINCDPLFSSYSTSVTANTSTKFDDHYHSVVQPPSSHSQLLHSRPKTSSSCTGSSNLLASSQRRSSRKHSSSDNSAADQGLIQSKLSHQQQPASKQAFSFEIKEESNLFKSWSEPCLARRSADQPSRRQHFSQLESSHPSLRKSLVCMMRNTKPKFPELSRVEFLETYGFGSKKTQDKKFTSSKQKSKSFTAKIFQENESDQQQPLGTKLNSYDNSKKSSKINRTRNLSLRSIPSTKIMDEKKTSGRWFKKHSFRLASRRNISQERISYKNDEEFQNYASKTLAYMGGNPEMGPQQGFLSIRNKKKNWDRYWCVFSNDVLKFYDKPHSKAPTQTLTLAGYEYVADVSASTQKHFAIKAQKKGSPTYHFGTDDFEDIVAWMRRLDQKNLPKESNLDGKVKAQTLPTLCFKKEFMRRSEGDLSNQTFEWSVALQKHKLLQEIEVEKKKILKELNILEKQNSGTPPSPSTSSTPRSPQLGSTCCNHFHVPNQDTKDSLEEEQKVTRYMALLHRRRNSQQLKIDQVSRELTTTKRPSIKKKKSRKVGGGSGDKSRNRQVGPDSEAVQKQKTPLVFKLIEMRQELSHITQEIKRVHTFKKSFLEKLDEKVDAENLSQQKPIVQGANQLLTKSLSHNSDHNLICDMGASLTNTSSTIESLNSLEYPSSSSSSSEHIGHDDVNCDRPPLCKTKSLEPTINNKIISLVEMDKKHGWKSSEYLPNSKVDPSVLASIQMFEKFSEVTLAKIKSQKSKSSK